MKKCVTFLFVIRKSYIYLHINNSKQNTMTTEEIIQMLMLAEEELYSALTNAKLVFGEDSEAYKVARARWSTTYELLKTIKNENA